MHEWDSLTDGHHLKVMGLPSPFELRALKYWPPGSTPLISCFRKFKVDLERSRSIMGRGCVCCLVAQLCMTLLWAPWTLAHQTPLSMDFPGKSGNWSGLPFPSPGDLPTTQGLNPCLLHWQAYSYHWATREAQEEDTDYLTSRHSLDTQVFNKVF